MAPTVLVVDDDQDIRESLAQILVEEGFEVASACNGAEALEAIARRQPDLMLLDLMMPVLNGWEVLEALRASGTRPRIPVVVLSALEAHGCVDYVQKPIRLPKLLALIETIRARITESATMSAASLATKDPPS
jgi:CheY-like chemotaxis protein